MFEKILYSGRHKDREKERKKDLNLSERASIEGDAEID